MNLVCGEAGDPVLEVLRGLVPRVSTRELSRGQQGTCALYWNLVNAPVVVYGVRIVATFLFRVKF